MSKGTFYGMQRLSALKGGGRLRSIIITMHFLFMSPFFLFVLFVLEQIENIDACLSFLAAKGINIQGLSAEGESIGYLRFHVK